MNRITLRPLSSIAISQTTSSAGASDGADATMAANSRAAEAEADHERAAMNPAKNSHGSSRCTRMAAGRPAARALRKVGASIQSTAAMARIDARSESRVAASQAPRAASGRARK